HPDHLHFPTLKKIKGICPQEITLLFKKQSNAIVKDAVKKLGYRFQELEPLKKARLNENLAVTSFPLYPDCAAAFEFFGKLILNQNDTYFREKELDQIKRA